MPHNLERTYCDMRQNCDSSAPLQTSGTGEVNVLLFYKREYGRGSEWF
jgi:hypothetical protein